MMLQLQLLQVLVWTTIPGFLCLQPTIPIYSKNYKYEKKRVLRVAMFDNENTETQIMSDVFHSVLKNKELVLNKNKNTFLSAGDIKKNDILLVEHCFYEENKQNGKFDVIPAMLAANKDLFNLLSPHTFPWRLEFSRLMTSRIMPEEFGDLSYQQLSELIDQKFRANAFITGQGDAVVGKEASLFPHSHQANAEYIHIVRDFTGFEYSAYFIAVVAKRDITKGEEISITFDESRRSHSRQYVLDGLISKDNDKSDSVIRNSMPDLMDRIDKYTRSEDFRGAMFAQHLMHRGLYTGPGPDGDSFLRPQLLDHVANKFDKGSTDRRLMEVAVRQWREAVFSQYFDSDPCNM